MNLIILLKSNSNNILKLRPLGVSSEGTFGVPFVIETETAWLKSHLLIYQRIIEGIQWAKNKVMIIQPQ